MYEWVFALWYGDYYFSSVSCYSILTLGKVFNTDSYASRWVRDRTFFKIYQMKESTSFCSKITLIFLVSDRQLWVTFFPLKYYLKFKSEIVCHINKYFEKWFIRFYLMCRYAYSTWYDELVSFNCFSLCGIRLVQRWVILIFFYRNTFQLPHCNSFRSKLTCI